MIHPFKGTKPEIDASALVVDSAQIIGDVKIGEESSVWFNAVIRGDVNFIRIGKRTISKMVVFCMWHAKPCHWRSAMR